MAYREDGIVAALVMTVFMLMLFGLLVLLAPGPDSPDCVVRGFRGDCR